jgi:hypothetical protein
VILQAWKAQIDAGLQALEAIAEGAIKMREAQLQAATEAHADLEATRKALAAASDASQILQICGEWARANAGKSAAYWRRLGQTVIA